MECGPNLAHELVAPIASIKCMRIFSISFVNQGADIYGDCEPGYHLAIHLPFLLPLPFFEELAAR